ncbi:MAG: hypothetical protein KKE17_04320 [Proteobacteria bacterium]|nr:hypothetical protein [Pseudomonadota bacterium]
MLKKSSYDFNLILATAVVLFIISAISIYGMFYFKFAEIHQMPPATKSLYMHNMNKAVTPFILALILLLGICVPKRLLPVVWVNRFAVFLVAAAVLCGIFLDWKTAILTVLIASLILQTIVLFMAVAGSEKLNFIKKGYWLRVGSSLIHQGLILFILDLLLYRYHTLHLVLFWFTTISTVVGMIFCFYSEAVAWLIAKIRSGVNPSQSNDNPV